MEIPALPSTDTSRSLEAHGDPTTRFLACHIGNDGLKTFLGKCDLKDTKAFIFMIKRFFGCQAVSLPDVVRKS